MGTKYEINTYNVPKHMVLRYTNETCNVLLSRINDRVEAVSDNTYTLVLYSGSCIAFFTDTFVRPFRVLAVSKHFIAVIGSLGALIDI